jgi:hypothetical protein
MKSVVGLYNPVSVAFEVVSDLRHYASGVCLCLCVCVFVCVCVCEHVRISLSLPPPLAQERVRSSCVSERVCSHLIT